MLIAGAYHPKGVQSFHCDEDKHLFKSIFIGNGILSRKAELI